MLKQQYDNRLQAMLDRWLGDLRLQSNAELLDRALEIYLELDNYCHAAQRSEREKARALAAEDLDYGAPAGSCLDFEPDDEQLGAVVEAVAGGKFGRGEYPCFPYDSYTESDEAALKNELLQKLRAEYEDHVVNVYLEMEKEDLILHVDSYLILKPFCEELIDHLRDLTLSRQAMETMLRLENTLDVLFTEYEGSSLAAFMDSSSFDELKEWFPAIRPAVSETELRL